MESVEVLRRRIGTARDLRSVVRTMKALAAVGLRQSERAAASVAHYNQVLERGLQAILHDHVHELTMYESSPPRFHGALVLGTDQGMCGQFNDAVVDYMRKSLGAAGWDLARTTVWAVGLRAEARLADHGLVAQRVFDTPASAAVITATVHDVALHLDRWRAERQPYEIRLFHHYSRSGSDELRELWVLPARAEWLKSLATHRWVTPALPMTGGNWRELYSQFVRQYLFVTLYRALAESLMTEQAARLRAMQTAERNVEEMIDALDLQHHQTRQGTITAELLDVVSGFEALTHEQAKAR